VVQRNGRHRATGTEPGLQADWHLILIALRNDRES
jgi:hypothetical protein